VTTPAWEAVGVGDGTLLLDLGCGDGAFCGFAARRGAIVSGVDFEPDAVAAALEAVPAGDFRLGMMESLPWADDSFDVVTAFNAVQYALDPDLALVEAARVLRPEGRIAVCKWGPPAGNEFFAFLTAIAAGGVRGEVGLVSDPVSDAISAARLQVIVTGEVAAPIEMAGDAALEASLSRVGIAAATSVTAAAAPYRRADGGYRFDNRLRYWVLRRRG
jgi:SAM-dependent methyltransferase